MSAITPPYIPRFGNGAPAGAAPNGTIYYDRAAGYAAYIYDGGQWNTTAGLIIGAGVPSFIAAPGTLFSRNDAAELYASAPTSVAASVVHFGHSAGHGTPGSVTISGAPTAGNLILACLNGSGAAGNMTIDATKWTIAAQGQNQATYGYLLYRYAQAGDTAVLPAFCTASTNPFWGATAVEIDGVTGSFAADTVAPSTIFNQNAATFLTPSYVTNEAGQLGVLFNPQYDGTANPITPATWTNVTSWNDGAASFGAEAVDYIAPANGTDLSALITRVAGSNDQSAITIIINPGLAAGWTLIGP